MRKLTILVDMDNTIENLTEVWVKYLNEKYGTEVDCNKLRVYSMTDSFPTLTSEEVYGVLSEQELWNRVCPIEFASECLKRLIDAGHEVYIVTATDYRIMQMKMDTVLFKYFPFLSWDNVIITSQKYLINGDVIVDDCVQYIEKFDGVKILVDMPYNHCYDDLEHGVFRCHDWKDIESIINCIALGGST